MSHRFMDFVSFGSHNEIIFVEPPYFVRPPIYGYSAPFDSKLWMMALRFG